MKIEVKVYRDDGTLISQAVCNGMAETSHSYQQPILERADRSQGLVGWKLTPYWIDLPREASAC